MQPVPSFVSQPKGAPHVLFVVINKLYKPRRADRHTKETVRKGKSEPRVEPARVAWSSAHRDLTNDRIGRHWGRRIKIIDMTIKSIY